MPKNLVGVETEDLLDEMSKRFGSLVVVGSDPIEPNAPEAFHHVKGSTFTVIGMLQWAQRAVRQSLVTRESDDV